MDRAETIAAHNLKEAIYSPCPNDGTIGRALTAYIGCLDQNQPRPLTRIFPLIETSIPEEDREIFRDAFDKIEMSPALPWSNARRAASEILCAVFLMEREKSITRADKANGIMALAAHYYSLGSSDEAVVRRPYHGMAGLAAPIRGLYAAEALEKDGVIHRLPPQRRRIIWDLIVILDPRQRSWFLPGNRLEASLIDAPLIPIFGLSYERYLREIAFLEEECEEKLSKQQIFAIIRNIYKDGWSGIAKEYFTSITMRIAKDFKIK